MKASVVCRLGMRVKNTSPVIEQKMRAIALPGNSFEILELESRLLRRRHRLALALTAYTAAFLVTGLFGLVLASASLVHVVSSASRAAILGNALLVLTFPLLFLAAHCLDKMDEVNSAIRVANAPRIDRDH